MERLEWLEWRKKGMGSSDAPVIMGVSPWSTALQLYEQKISTEPVEDNGNFITDRGNKIEPQVRSLYELMTSREYPVALFEMESHPYIRASLDGWNETNKEIIEIKLSGKEDFEGTLKGIVPEKYMPQIQHQLMVTNARACFYLSYLYNKESNDVTPINLAIVEVLPNKEYQKLLLSEETNFWECVTKKTPPPASDRDFKTMTGHAKLVNQWKKAKEDAILINDKVETLETEIKKIADEAGHPRLKCAGMKMTKVSRVGNVDYKKVPELKGINLDQYRGKSSLYWKMSLDNEAE